MSGHGCAAALEAGCSGLLTIVRDSARLAEGESSVDAAVLRSLRSVGEAADLDYIGVALLVGASAHFDVRYEWCADSEAEARGRRVAARCVRVAMPRLQRLETVDRRFVLIVPLVAHGALTGYAIAVRRGRRDAWTAVEKDALALAAEMLMAKLGAHAAQRHMRARERQLRLVLSATKDAVYEWNAGAPDMLWNDSVLALTGHSAESFDSSLEACFARIDDRDRDRVVARFYDVLRGTGASWSEEYRLRRRDGSTIWIATRAFIQRDALGNAVKLTGAVSDVTERREAEEARRASDERYHRLVDQADDLIVGVDTAGRITSLNLAFETITGWPRAEWIGRGVTELLADAAAFASGVTRQNLRFATRSGAIVEMDVTISPVADGGVVGGASWIARDVTERHRAERERAELSNRIEMLLESTYEGIVAVDEAGLCTLVNASACRILGCEPSDLLGRPFHDFVHPRHAHEGWRHAKTLCPLGALLEMQHAMPLAEETFARRDGTLLPVQFAGAAVAGARPHPAGAVVTFSDVTERKMLETELERANRMASLGHVAATIAHEFNNVLMGIQPALDLMLRRAAGNAAMAEPLSRIGQAVQRGKRIALEILRFSRPLHAMLAPLPLQPWLRDMAGEAAALLGGTHAVALDVPEEPLFVNADRELLHQAFVNLVSNARDAMKAPGTLRIAVQRAAPHSPSLITPGRFIAVSVSDTGHGMAKETLDRVFEPLFTTKTGRGTGLGLAVVHRIITAHGGYIFAESEPGKGSAFTMFLAVAEPERVAAAASAAARPAIPANTRVLLVEDDANVAAGTMAMLSLEEIDAEAVSAGAEAIAAVERFAPTVVLLDVGLPDTDGREVFAALRAHWPSLPVIFSTGHAETGGVGGEAARVRLLQKPYEIGALLQCIAEITKETS
jgi:PAS domain S-box-containing protein